MSFIDVRKAYFHGVPARKLHVCFPKKLGAQPGRAARLVRCMYGTRDAGAIWEETYAKALLQMGLTCGRASACCFHHEAWGI